MTLRVRIYADSVEELTTVCSLCADKVECDKSVHKKCMVWCG